MSKLIKGMEIEALRKDFKNVKDYVFLEVQGITAQNNTALRATLRKKKIHLKVVKNTLARMVLTEQGVNIAKDSPYLQGPTVLVWGSSSISELCRGLEAELKNPKTAAGYTTTVKIKGAVADSLPVPFDVAIKMPTREEAIGNIAGMLLAPGAKLASQIISVGGIIASQIKTISERIPAETTGATAESTAS
ncbi:MAG: 50S ribosomal protein L10 [Planctomycetes bacterium]|nr:50S ribosomal protein L10 [Planctomycetota bacterium]NBY03084.1 50S ribosomal protein L10 [Planctomycetota bacterium]